MHRVVGDRTATRWIGRFTVAGLCRTFTGFATTRRSTDVGRQRSTAPVPAAPAIEPRSGLR